MILSERLIKKFEIRLKEKNIGELTVSGVVTIPNALKVIEEIAWMAWIEGQSGNTKFNEKFERTMFISWFHQTVNEQPLGDEAY